MTLSPIPYYLISPDFFPKLTNQSYFLYNHFSIRQSRSFEIIMKVLINKIPKEGIEIHSSENAETLNIPPSEMELRDSVFIDAKITTEGPVLFADGSLRTVVNITCSRCGIDFLYDVDVFFHCHEEPLSQASKEVSLFLLKKDMDIDLYGGNEIELNDIFREQLLLAVPMYPLCKEDCLGLCPVCGLNLNTGTCNCHTEDIASPFRAIKGLFKEQ